MRHGPCLRAPAPEPFVSKYKPGTIVVRIRERRLYHLTDPGQAVSYSIGAARPGIQFYGRTMVTQKREQPIWIPTRNQRRLYRGLPSRVVPGPDNPLGSRAINLAGATCASTAQTSPPPSASRALGRLHPHAGRGHRASVPAGEGGRVGELSSVEVRSELVARSVSNQI